MKPHKLIVSEQGVPNLIYKDSSLCSYFLQNFDLNKLKYGKLYEVQLTNVQILPTPSVTWQHFQMINLVYL